MSQADEVDSCGLAIKHTTAFHSFNHTWEDKSKTIIENELYSKKIIVCDDVWISCNCVILSGVKIESRSVIAAGSIVNKNVSENSLFAGNPAKFIKNI